MRWIVGLIAVAVLFLAGRWAILHIALDPSCSNEVLRETLSPDGKYVAVVFERGCGATTSSQQIVMLREAKDKFDPEDYQEWIFTAKHQPTIKAEWDSPTHLTVKSDATDDSPNPPDKWRDVQITRKSL